ncbi:hypothetical protein [Lacticaseibacillus sharpeae]|uniref:DUF4811 domain-containing protein n=1 Tax=Lacticaseibacillus sharpeae JCM 1186 = DSM 20505 TaxID=1291052 RepID=A0A0R1ZLY9_9LACO|nr:hypothetical protein [Lacticaseibacillus sharpeae]KRM56017.1 hypothetical protein FC18_GL000800 [Lacticaseibacillus sharpeae JCM 1186 = DSM 20505]
MILIVFGVLAVAFFACMIFLKRSRLRKALVATTGALLAVCAVLLTLTMLNGFGFQKTTKTTQTAFAESTKVTKNGSGKTFSVTVKDPSGRKTTYKNDGGNLIVKLHKGNVAMMESKITTQKAENSFVKFMYMFTGMDGKTTKSYADISIPTWTTK